MTVEELINKLQEFDPKLPIMLHGYEGGVYAGPNHFYKAEVALDVNKDWYYGPHEILHDYMQEDCKTCTKITALIIK